MKLQDWISSAISTFKKVGKDVKDTRTSLSNKVDKETGKSLSEANFTQQEKDKLSGLSLMYQGNYVSLAALKSARPEGSASDSWANKKAGFYADVDGGTGKEVVRYIWDANDFKWVAQLGASSQLAASEVKTLYESNSNTNAYTDAEKVKVSVSVSIDQVSDALDGWVGDEDPLTAYTSESGT